MRAAPLAVVGALLMAGCNWVSLAINAFGYQTVARGEAANLVAHDSLIYVTRAEDGVAIVDARTRATILTVPPPPGTESIDDLALADGLLFVLDARVPGHLGAFSLENPARPRLVSAPRPVPVEPFAGVSCAQGRCVVSGGTSRLTAWRYDRNGILSGPVDSADLGRGQPDVTLSADGRRAFVSTHFWGPYFGLDLLSVSDAGRVEKLGELAIDGAGFTAGGSRPANFPIQAAPLGTDTVLVVFERGLAVVSVAEPARPVSLEVLELGAPAVSVSVRGRSALVALAGREPSLALMDFSGARLRLERQIPLPAGAQPSGVVLTERFAAVAARSMGVIVFDR